MMTVVAMSLRCHRAFPHRTHRPREPRLPRLAVWNASWRCVTCVSRSPWRVFGAFLFGAQFVEPLGAVGHARGARSGSISSAVH